MTNVSATSVRVGRDFHKLCFWRLADYSEQNRTKRDKREGGGRKKDLSTRVPGVIWSV